jgi:hypothetical protein
MAITFAAPVALPLLSNLQGLAHGAAKPLGQIGAAATGYVDRTFTLRLTTGATVVSSGQILVFLITAENATPVTDWTDGINPAAVVTQNTKITDASLSQLAYRLGAGANTTITPSTVYTIPQFSVLSVLGMRPSFCSVVVWNLSGGALSANAADFAGFSTLQT